MDLRPVDPFYKIRFDDGETLACHADLDAMRAEVARISPEDAAGFDRFIRDSEKIYDIAFTQLVDQPFHKLGTLLTSVPDLVRLQGYRTVYRKVSDYFRHPKLRVAFSFHPLLIGGNPLTTTAYYCLIAHLERTHRVHYAMGGMGALVQGIVGLIQGLGGTLRYEAEVARIEVANGRATGVTLASGETIGADVVVSNADVGWTYSKLLGHHPRKRWTDAKVERARYSMSLFVWYFGTNKRFDSVYHHTMVLGPRYEALLRDIFTRKHLSEDFSLYLHRPSMTDPSLAPPGCDSFYVLAPVPNLGSRTDWAAQAELLSRRHPAAAGGHRAAGPRAAHRHLPRVDAAGFPRSAAERERRRLLARAAAVPERLVPAAQCQRGGRGPLPRRRGHASRRGVPGVICSAKILDEVVPAPGALIRRQGGRPPWRVVLRSGFTPSGGSPPFGDPIQALAWRGEAAARARVCASIFRQCQRISPIPVLSGIAHITGFSASFGMIRTEPKAMKAV
ncbi:phytoene desaturase family protein [Dankookia sp. P2]|uniref:phytoene desaturase family protein n=1 Tax=Dankookia sp. P2 TaxID=3423955 RepID=UPI003D6642ED